MPRTGTDGATAPPPDTADMTDTADTADTASVQVGRTLLDEHLAVAAATADLLPGAAAVAAELVGCFRAGGTLLTFGNGGSAADAQHLAAEMVGRFRRDRRPLSAVALTVDSSAMTSIGNDYGFEQVFARQVRALARPGDVVVGVSTSGTSPNVVAGLAAARSAGARTVLLTGAVGRPGLADHCLAVPSTTTARIQELHVFLIHLVSEIVDAWAVGGDAAGDLLH